MSVRILRGDCMDVLKTLPDESVHCVVTSPPYFGLRDYGAAGQIGLESTPAEYVEKMVAVFREVRRVLRDDGTLWLNLGDSYASGGRKTRDPGQSKLHPAFTGEDNATTNFRPNDGGAKPKDLLGIPWRVAFALQADGWYLRQDIIWCLSGGAWVYARTQKGDMPVMVKDLVRLKPSTVKLWNGTKWTQVLGWGASNDTSQRMELVLRSGERIGCTGGHLWPTQRGNFAARDLRPGDVIQTCRLPEPATVGAPMYLTRDLLWLIGLYLAEGSRAGDTIQLSLNADEAPWLERIEAAADGLGASMTHTKRGSNLSVRLYGRVLAAAIEEFIGGKTAHDKHLRAPAWNLPGWALRCIADGYLDGDGHWDQKARRWRLGFARNYALERDLRTLAARLGATLTLHPGEATYQGGKKPSFRGEWRWNRTGHRNEKDRGEVVEIRASRARKFWDIAVEDDPHLFALASGVLTHNCKPNPMPESVRDRCTKAHEYLFLLAKSERYYFDADAIAESCESGESDLKKMREQLPRIGGKHKTLVDPLSMASSSTNIGQKRSVGNGEQRNKRSVWTVATQPFKEAHFATFPPALIEPCILAGTSSHGYCAKCGAPWVRQSEPIIQAGHTGSTDSAYPEGSTANRLALLRQAAREQGVEYTGARRTTGWKATCACAAGIVPGVVLDPFGGAGTTGLVADRLGRDAILIELNPAYADMAENRIRNDAPLFAEVA